MPRSNPTFSVDTHVFRELGELLVGRDSTALLELIKNAYDADATSITVAAVNLDTPERGEIVIRDNGSGMDGPQFEKGFLRIASRFKEEGERRSKYFGRRFTGSKGIGRLAAHKLAKVMEVDSVCGDPSRSSRDSINARIDWERIEQKEILSDLLDEVSLETSRLARPAKTGTTISLRRLRRAWSDKERVRFVNECRSFQVPEVLRVPIPGRILTAPLLLPEPQLRDARDENRGCEIHLEGDFSEGDNYWDMLVDATNWVLEIDAKTDRARIRYSIIPAKSTKKTYPEVRRREFDHPHPCPDEGPFFQARILARDEQIRAKQLVGAYRQMSGIRVYLEGFRVLPYGDPGDDWLRLDADVARRSWKTDEIFNGLIEGDGSAGDWQLSVLPNSSYTGAVFLTQNDAPTLRMLVNREGFVTDRAFDILTDTVRRGIDLLTRTRVAEKAPSRTRIREERKRANPPQTTREPAAVTEDERPGGTPVAPTPDDVKQGPTLVATTAEVLASVSDARELLASGVDPQTVSRKLDAGRDALDRLVSSAARIEDSAAMLRVLASLGTQVASFVHEIRGLLGMAIAIHEAVERLRADSSIRGEARRSLVAVYQSLGDMRRQIERQAAYLIDITSPDARRRRSRQRLSERFDAAAKLVMPAVDRRGIELTNAIPSSLKSPPMFPAELTVVFSNLLTNAIKAAGEGGKIHARGGPGRDGGCVMVLENTGRSVDLSEAERWFRPFESTTTEVDSTLGQGMGLGLTITRDLLEQYGATIGFVAPSPPFATAVEVQFPG